MTNPQPGLFDLPETAAVTLCAACNVRPAETRNHCRACIARGDTAQTFDLFAGPLADNETDRCPRCDLMPARCTCVAGTCDRCGQPGCDCEPIDDESGLCNVPNCTAPANGFLPGTETPACQPHMDSGALFDFRQPADIPQPDNCPPLTLTEAIERLPGWLICAAASADAPQVLAANLASSGGSRHDDRPGFIECDKTAMHVTARPGGVKVSTISYRTIGAALVDAWQRPENDAARMLADAVNTHRRITAERAQDPRPWIPAHRLAGLSDTERRDHESADAAWHERNKDRTFAARVALDKSRAAVALIAAQASPLTLI